MQLLCHRLQRGQGVWTNGAIWVRNHTMNESSFPCLLAKLSLCTPDVARAESFAQGPSMTHDTFYVCDELASGAINVTLA